MSSTMTIKGFEELEAKLREKFNETRVKSIEGKALGKSADEAVVNLKSTLEGFANSGDTASGVVRGNVSRASGFPMIKIGNNGKHWRLVHLENNGFTRDGKSYRYRSFGALQKFAAAQGNKFVESAQRELKELIE
ncbi:HK97 gp10 family phage protein [Lactococcus lactis]|uniref:HK97 gp10 family phage protein n=1 Tax=Lactococcus lactis TaxID=1358 RepID=A0AAP3Z2I0_9LACT|nr:HK97 gp10 family phage protein [Lactococcus lactis]MDG4969257.1 HK97 gp10 family phage protein [Lactococcus lactis]MDG4977188.1 HK97 gp10 family phage protein [Lactococcus lactis]MDG5103351.1 HK97 gp10 family phage protein [Lactococcus lactis]TNU78253.1 HK97 gp10 family phage protein [Lactococcus lactis subsp. lactis]